MTYDEWKLETPEDEADRKRRRPRIGGSCPYCYAWGSNWAEPTEDGNCYECGEPLNERDPDDARDDMQDREMNQ